MLPCATLMSISVETVCFFESSIAGLVAQAVIATLVTILTMLTLFRTGIIRATEKFRSILFTATLSIGAIYLIQFIASVFFGRSIPQIFTVSPIGIGFSLFVVGIAALNLINDFDFKKSKYFTKNANCIFPYYI